MTDERERSGLELDPGYEEGVAPYDTAHPVKSLMRAVVMRALRDLESAGEERIGAQDYFFRNSNGDLFSFRGICEALGLPYEETRQMVARRYRPFT